jgi:hypothetical protein
VEEREGKRDPSSRRINLSSRDSDDTYVEITGTGRQREGRRAYSGAIYLDLVGIHRGVGKEDLRLLNAMSLSHSKALV